MSEQSIGPDDAEEVGYDTLIDRIKKEAGKKLAEFKMRSLAPREDVDKWRSDVARAERVRAFLGGEFWKKDFEPLIHGESRIRPCRPDSVPGSVEQATTEYLYKSGASWLVEMIEARLRDWVTVGAKSEVLLRAEMERRKTLTGR